MSGGEAPDGGTTPEELLERFLQEKPADVEEFLRRHPEHAEELRALIPAMRVLGQARQALASRSVEEHLAVVERWREAREEVASGRTVEAVEPASAKGAPEDFVSGVLARLEPHGGRLEPEGELARGGQGVVLAVWDGTLRRHLAMKVALASGEKSSGRPSDTRSLGRFLEEAQVTAQLDHPGIVPVHDLGLDRERRVYFTMKLVKGRDLRAIFELVRTNSEGWTETRALNVLLKVCEAMAYAHSKGVIHRDLKPSNVMVGRFGEVYVMDWGLARVQGSEDRKDIRIQAGLSSAKRSPRHEPEQELDSPLITMDGDVVGTPAFMPPEQARGELAAMGSHSDVYALGAMLYQLLTDRMPYVPPGARLSNRAVWALVQEGPPDPVQALVKDVPAELVAICEKAMARDVTARYAHMGELAEDLRAYMEHRVVSAYERGALAELRKWVRRNRRLALTMAGALLVLLTLTVFYVRSLSAYARDLSASNLTLEAQNRSLRAQSLASASLDAASADAMLSLLLAREAVRVEQTPETLSQLHRAVGAVRERALCEHESNVFETAFSPRGDVFLTVTSGSTGSVALWDLHGNRLARLVHDGTIIEQPLFTSSGAEVLTASGDGTARLWDLAGRELVRFMHGQELMAADLSGDERFVLTGAVDGTVKLWERGGRLLRDWKAHEDVVLDLAFSPVSGDWLFVSACADARASLWRLDDSDGSVTRVADLGAHTGPVTLARFSPSGERVLTVAGFAPRWTTSRPGGRAWLWDRDGAPVATLEAPTGGLEWAGFSRDGKCIVSFSLGGALQLWDTETGRLRASGRNGSKTAMWPGDSSPEGDLFVGPGADGSVWLFDSAAQTVTGWFGHDAEIISAHFSPDGRQVLTGAMDKTARLWDVRPELPEYHGHQGCVKWAAYSPDGRLVVTASDDETARIWELGGAERAVLRGHQGYIRWAGFTPDGQRTLTVAEDGSARLWDLAGNELHVFAHKGSSLTVGAISGRGDRIATGDRNGVVREWDLERGTPLARFESQGERARSLAFLADGECLLVGSGTTAVIYAPDGTPEQTFGPHPSWVDCAEMSPAEDVVVTCANGDSVVHLWSRDGRPLAELRGHDGGVSRASFSPDGTRIVTSSIDKTARVWSRDGQLLFVLRGHDGGVASACFAPDGRRILTASGDGTARTWFADPAELLRFADRRAIRGFTPVELARYSELLDSPGREPRALAVPPAAR